MEVGHPSPDGTNKQYRCTCCLPTRWDFPETSLYGSGPDSLYVVESLECVKYEPLICHKAFNGSYMNPNQSKPQSAQASRSN